MTRNFLSLATVVALFCVASALAEEDQGQVYDSHNFDRTVIKNRARLQEQSGAYKDTAEYKYCDDKEIEKEMKEQAGRKDGRVDLCTGHVDANNQQKKVRVAVDTNKEIVVNNAKEVNIGTVDVDTKRGGGRGVDVSTFGREGGGITVKGRYGQ